MSSSSTAYPSKIPYTTVEINADCSVRVDWIVPAQTLVESV